MGFINQTLPPVEAKLVAAMAWGEGNLGSNLYQSLVASGLIHLVVVSGTNVMLIVRNLVENLAEVWGRKVMIVISLILMWGYVGVVGWQIPVVRAGLLVTLIYYAQFVGRKFDLGRAILVVVILMVIGDWRVIEESSFWLTMAAFLGMVTQKRSIFYDLRFMNNPVMRSMGQTIWVSIWITPILALNFGKISLVAPLTNVLVLGLTEVVVVGGILGSMLRQGWILMWLLPIVRWIEMVAGWGAKWQVWEVKFNWWLLIGWYLVLGYFLIRRKINED